MSYRCHNCRQVPEPGTKATRVVLATREVEYKDWRGNLVSRGYETTREVDVCPSCVRRQSYPDQRPRILPTWLRRDGDGRVRLNHEEPTA